MNSLRMTLVVAMFVTVGCGEDDGEALDLANRDARCVAACTDDAPEIEGAGDVCNVTSRVSCLDECEARIAGVMGVCATCLVEDTCFDPNCDDASLGTLCDISGLCTVTGRIGTCSYPMNSTSGKEACERQVNPRREVACTADFRPTSECATTCT